MTELPMRDDTTARARVREFGSNVADNLRLRAPGLAAAVLITLAFVMFGGLSLRSGLAGSAALLLWAALWPGRASFAAMTERDLRRRLADADTAKSGPVWKSIVESLPDPALALDEKGDLLAFNAAAFEVFSAALPGRHISQITRAPELLASVESALETGELQSCRLDLKVPVQRSLVGTVAPLQSAARGSQSPQLLVVLRDLTEQDRLVRMRADFVANASHELRTPLASLKGFVETLQDAAKDDPIARERFLKIMQQQAERMARLIDDLLSLSRIEMRAHVMPREAADLSSIITHVVQTLAPIARDKSITVDFAAPSSPAIIAGDRDELIQVFQNLIENAIKYGRSGGLVAITTETATGAARGRERISISIKDDGPGIAAEHLPRLTERFYRVNAAQSRNAGGTGLGLAIVKHVLNRHQATLSVDSIIGQGSTFRVTFPLRREI